MQRNIVLVMGFLSISIAGASVDASTAPVDKPWEKVSSSDGITTYRKEIEGSDTIAFMGDTIIDAPIAKVAQVLIDTPRKTEWVADSMVTRDVRTLSQLERVEYNKTHAPWPIKDRDFVLRAKMELDKAQQRILVTFYSVEDSSVPENDDAVRGKVLRGQYILKTAEGGKTWIQVEIHADPMGSVPKWAVNLTQKSWPRKTLNGIAKQVAKPDVIEHPQVKAFFEGKIDQTASAVTESKKLN